MSQNCPQCGATNQDGSSQCIYCGEYLTPQYYQPPQQPYMQQPYQQQPSVNINMQNYAGMNGGISPAWPYKSKICAGLLAIFLGTFGIHRFYLGEAGAGVAYFIFSWTGIPTVISFVEGIIYFCESDYKFSVKHQVRL